MNSANTPAPCPLATLFSKPRAESLPPGKAALVVGNEVNGIDENLLDLCDRVIEIPMLGQKESFNVVQAAAMAMFYLRLAK